MFSNYIVNGTSFVDQLKSNKNKNNNTKPPGASQAQMHSNNNITTSNNYSVPRKSYLQNECYQYFGEDLFSILNKINCFIPEYKKLQGKQRPLKLVEFLLNCRMNNKIFNIVQLNINSLRSVAKRQELNNFIKKEKPDILLLNETKLNSKYKMSFENFELIRTDRPNNNGGGGGTGILIHSSISHKIIPVHNLNSVECTAIEMPLSKKS